jgi:hypothetical protein
LRFVRRIVYLKFERTDVSRLYCGVRRACFLFYQSAFAAPRQSYGKTVIVNRNESREQKFPDEEQMRHISPAL